MDHTDDVIMGGRLACVEGKLNKATSAQESPFNYYFGMIIRHELLFCNDVLWAMWIRKGFNMIILIGNTK